MKSTGNCFPQRTCYVLDADCGWQSLQLSVAPRNLLSLLNTTCAMYETFLYTNTKKLLSDNFYCCTVYYGIYILFTHQQMHFLLNLEKFIFMAPTCFGLRPFSGNLYRAWLKLHFLLKHSVKIRRVCSLHNKQHTRHFTTCCHISTQYKTT